MNDLIVSLMGALCTLVGVIVTCLVTSSGTKRLTEYRLNELRTDFNDLRERVNKHNNLLERMVTVEQSTKSAHKRLDSLESSMHQA